MLRSRQIKNKKGSLFHLLAFALQKLRKWSAKAKRWKTIFYILDYQRDKKGQTTAGAASALLAEKDACKPPFRVAAKARRQLTKGLR